MDATRAHQRRPRLVVTTGHRTRSPEPAGDGRTTSLGGPPPPDGGLGHGTGLPSGNPLSTRTPVEEGPWGEVHWGGADYPAEALNDSDLVRV